MLAGPGEAKPVDSSIRCMIFVIKIGLLATNFQWTNEIRIEADQVLAFSLFSGIFLRKFYHIPTFFGCDYIFAVNLLKVCFVDIFANVI